MKLRREKKQKGGIHECDEKGTHIPFVRRKPALLVEDGSRSKDNFRCFSRDDDEFPLVFSFPHVPHKIAWKKMNRQGHGRRKSHITLCSFLLDCYRTIFLLNIFPSSHPFPLLSCVRAPLICNKRRLLTCVPHSNVLLY